MNIDMDYIKTEAAKQCYWLKDGVFNLPEWTRINTLQANS